MPRTPPEIVIRDMHELETARGFATFLDRIAVELKRQCEHLESISQRDLEGAQGYIRGLRWVSQLKDQLIEDAKRELGK